MDYGLGAGYRFAWDRDEQSARRAPSSLVQIREQSARRAEMVRVLADEVRSRLRPGARPADAQAILREILSTRTERPYPGGEDGGQRWQTNAATTGALQGGRPGTGLRS